jgi:DNA-binding CsgD family transcriptional regulator
MRARAGVALIAAAAVGVNVWQQVDWRLALAAGVAVALFGELVGPLIRSRRVPAPTPPTDPQPLEAPLLQAVASRAHPLTRREAEVAVLVGQGLTNKEISVRLSISERTVDNHVQHIYNKLDIGSRPQLALWARDRGLL